MKVALLLAPSEIPLYDNRFYGYSPMPLTLGILQACLKKNGHEVSAFDLNTQMRNFAEEPLIWSTLYDKEKVMKSFNCGKCADMEGIFERFISSYDLGSYDVVGISTGSNLSFFELHFAFLLGLYVQYSYRKTVVFGGANLSFLWQLREIFRELWDLVLYNFSYVIVGPGERALCQLIEDFGSYRDIPGAVYRDKGELICNPEANYITVCPDFSGLTSDNYHHCVSKDVDDNLRDYYGSSIIYAPTASERNRKSLNDEEVEEKLFIPYIFNYNCNFRCAFCVQSSGKKATVISSADTVVNDLKNLMKIYNTKYFRFYDNAFNMSIPFVREFCRLVEDEKLEFYWSDCARFDNLDEELVQMMYRSGCRKLIFGLDTASPKTLKYIGKRLDLNHARQVLKWCRQYGIWVELEIIVGLPYDDEFDFEYTYSFVREVHSKDFISGINVNRYFVIPESRLGSFPERYGIELHSDLSAYDKMLSQGAGFIKALANSEMPKSFVYRSLSFSEPGRRTSEQISEQTQAQYERMLGLMLEINACKRRR